MRNQESNNSSWRALPRLPWSRFVLAPIVLILCLILAGCGLFGPSETVATPTFSPAEGTYTTAQNVAISCSTTGASIRYTTDGTAPTSTTGIVYSNAVAVSSTMTIKAIAYKDGMKDSSVATAAYTITPASHSLSGHVYDSVTGAGASGLTVDFATYTATTGSDGSFTIDLGNTGGTVSGGVCAHGTGYGVMYAAPVSLDTSNDTQVSLYVTPISSSAYTTHSVTITIRNSSSIEIPAGTYVSYFILNSAGGFTSIYGNYATGGVTFNSPTFGSDCLVAVTVNLSPAFNVMEKQVDLSALSTTVALTQDSGAHTTVNVTGDANGNIVWLSLSSPYGAFGAASFSLSGSPATATVNVTDPWGYTGIWMQMQGIANYLESGLTKVLYSISNAAIGTSVTLPAINSSLGPNEIPDWSSIAYSGGTLSITPVSGANFYQFMLFDTTATTSVGVIYSTSASVTLPSWLQSQLSGHSVSVGVSPMGTNMSLDLPTFAAMTGAHNGPPPITVQSGTIVGGSSKTLTF